MNIIIFGGSGFVGTELLNQLSNGVYQSLIIDKVYNERSLHTTIIHDIRNPIVDPQISGDVIINLAAEHRDDVAPVDLYYETNVNGSKNICDFARKKNINKIIFTSSVAVYGFSSDEIDESHKINPTNHYGKSKWHAEQIYKEWYDEDPINRTLIIIRPTVIFGEGNRGNVFNLFNFISSSKFVMVGNGENRKSMAYVNNVAAFIHHTFILKSGFHLFNYVDKPDYTMNDLVERVCKLLLRRPSINYKIPYLVGLSIGFIFDFLSILTGKKLSISSIRVKKFCANSVYKSSTNSTGFVAPFGIDEAVERTIKFEFL